MTSRILQLIVIVAIAAGCGLGRSANADGWWDEGVHAVDGYWVTEERPCEQADPEICAAAVETAKAVLLERQPAATVTSAVLAGYPNQQGEHANEITINLGGLHKPQFVILDLADGTRRTVALTCGPDLSTEQTITNTVCWETDFDIWRVSGT